MLPTAGGLFLRLGLTAYPAFSLLRGSDPGTNSADRQASSTEHVEPFDWVLFFLSVRWRVRYERA